MSASPDNSDFMQMEVRVVALSDKAQDDGLLFSGSVTVPCPDNEPLAWTVLRHLRSAGVDVQNGDVLFFPDGGAGHRVAVVRGRMGQEATSPTASSRERA